MATQFTEFDSAILTAENHGEAYRLLGYQGDNDAARTEILAVLIKHHVTLSNADMVAVANQVIDQWIEDANS